MAADNGQRATGSVKGRRYRHRANSAVPERVSAARAPRDRPRVWLSCPRQTAPKPANTPLVIARRRRPRVRDALRCYLALSAFVAGPCALRSLGKRGVDRCATSSPRWSCGRRHQQRRRRPRSASSSSPTMPTATASTDASRPARRCGAAVATAYCRSRDFAQAASFRKVDRDEITGAVPTTNGTSGPRRVRRHRVPALTPASHGSSFRPGRIVRACRISRVARGRRCTTRHLRPMSQRPWRSHALRTAPRRGRGRS